MQTPLLYIGQLVLILFMFLPFSQGWQTCPLEKGGGTCPTDDTCCASGIPGVSTCLSSTDNTTLGNCCTDHSGGCGQNFTCAVDVNTSEPFCQLRPHTQDDVPPRLPRYNLCTLPHAKTAFSRVMGWPIAATGGDDDDDDDKNSEVLFAAYFSSLGVPLDTRDESKLAMFQKITTVVFTVHGSRRNADDYLSCTYCALPESLKATTLVLSPWFLAPSDGPVVLFNQDETVEPLRWKDKGDNLLPHSYRYGADSLQGQVGSYAVMDSLLDGLIQQSALFPNLERIVITGHSAGGQYTHRWALLSNHALLEDASQRLVLPRVSLRIVAANPKSFTYLDGRRFTQDGRWELPTEEELYSCTLYNEWQWGLGSLNMLPAPWKDRAIQEAGGVDKVVQRYAHRPVVYLSGFLDVLSNGSCMDQVQGRNRRERSRYYLRYLNEAVYKRPTHARLEVAGVHHDHCLLYQSPEGQMALYGNESAVAAWQRQQEPNWFSDQMDPRPTLRRFDPPKFDS